MLERRKKSEGFVFADSNGNFLEENYTRRALKKGVSQLELTNQKNSRIMWHALRHTFASHLAMKGCSIYIIKELMGHKSTKTTTRYAHLAPSTLNDSIKLLSKKGQYLGSDKKREEDFVALMKSCGVQFVPKDKQRQTQEGLSQN